MATFPKAKDALASVAFKTQSVTAEQKALARKLKIVLDDHLPCLVAAARLKRAMARELFDEPVLPTPTQQNYLEGLAPPTRRLKLALATEDRNEMDAWIRYEELVSRAKALRALRLSENDVILVIVGSAERRATVHSFGENGKVYFKGGLGLGAWPDRISVLYRHDDDTEKATEARVEIANEVSRLTTARSWSKAREQELEQYKVNKRISEADVEEFCRIVDAASDERPIQLYLETCPQLLAALLTGRSRFVIPRPSLGGKHVPDFLLADVDSSGIRWVLLELETTGTGLALRSENNFDKYVRKGISQIEDWKLWLRNNLAHARECKANGGAGFPDIEPNSEGLVLAGRRDLQTPAARQIRRPFEENNRIRVHSYDWLIERLQGTLDYDGLPVLNPDALPL
jgi:hypothetical protein